MPDYPQSIVPAHHVAPVPRRIRAFAGGVSVLDSLQARYVWEWPNYPQYYVPVGDIAPGVLVADGDPHPSRLGTVQTHSLVVGTERRQQAARVYFDSVIDGIAGTVRFDWAALDSWFEEDEQVFVHPRDPYTRVDALRSTRPVRVEVDGVVLADSAAPVMVFETGLPTRYYLDRTDVRLEHLIASPTVTACPYKGVTSGYWSASTGGETLADIAWTYDFPTRQLLPIAGLIAFYNEKVDLIVDGVQLDRPQTHFS